MGLATRLALLSFLGVARAESHANNLVVGVTAMAASDGNATFDDKMGWEMVKIGVAEKLFTLDKDGEVVNQIAESISGEGKAWEVTIKTGIKFSDGSTLTAADVATCLTSMYDSPGASASLNGMTFVADGDTKVKITSTDSTHIMSYILAEYHFPIFKVSGTSTLYTGPYKITHFAVGDHMNLEPNGHYVNGEKRPNIQVRKYADAAALATAAKAKELDLAFCLDVADLEAVDAVEGMSTMSVGVTYQYFMIYNMNSARATKDLKVRQAIDLAVDRTALSQSIMGGNPTRSYFPEGVWHSDPMAKQTADAAAAATKLDGMDLTGANKLTVIAYVLRPDLITMLPKVKEQLELVTNVEIEAVKDNDTWADTGAGFWMPCGFPPSTPTEFVCYGTDDWDVPMWAQDTLPGGDPVSFLNRIGNEAGSMAKIAQFDPSAATDAKVAAVDQATTHAARKTASDEAQVAIKAELPVSTLLTPDWHIAISDKMKNMGYFAYGADYYIIRADAPIIGAGAVDSSALSMPVALALCAALLF
jgi:peptide/nickel transport system substrate-binding protein